MTSTALQSPAETMWRDEPSLAGGTAAGLLVPLAFGPLWAAIAPRWFSNPEATCVSGFVLLALLLVCTYTDLRWLRIPNWATYSALLWAWGLSLAAPLELAIRGEALALCTFCNPHAPVPAPVSYLSQLPLSESWWGAVACLAALLALAGCSPAVGWRARNAA